MSVPRSAISTGKAKPFPWVRRTLSPRSPANGYGQSSRAPAIFASGGAEIFTRVKNTAPTKYGANAIVKNSLVSDGCVIDGEVYNSILFRGVKVGRGTVIKDSVIMKNTITGENVTINCVVTDKNVVVRDRKTLSGTETFPIYIPKESIV